MKAIRIHTHLDSETLHLPQLREMVGSDVEIIVRTCEKSESTVAKANGSDTDRHPLHGTVLRYDEPFEPAVSPDEWEATR